MTASSENRTVLVALHYQNDVLHPDGKIKVGLSQDSPARQHVLQAAQSLLSRARALQLPIVHVRVAYRADYADLITNAPILRNVVAIGAMIDGEWGSQFYSSLAPHVDNPREFIVKHTRINAFYGSPLEEILRKLSATRLLVAGIATHSVVESTVRHAVDVGYEVMVAADACAAADPDTHAASLKSMSLIAQILHTPDLDQHFPLV